MDTKLTISLIIKIKLKKTHRKSENKPYFDIK